MFDASKGSRVFSIPMGQDFARTFAQGLLQRIQDQPPEALARTLVLTNSNRMGTAVKTALSSSGARLLPRIQTLDRVPDLPEFRLDLPPKTPALRRMLMLARATGAFLEAEPDVAPQSARFSLAHLLARLMDEMQAEGVSTGDLQDINIDRYSEHWARNLRFLQIMGQYRDSRRGSDPLDRLRLGSQQLAERWQANPPDTPIIIAGSTGSRGATSVLMKAVAALPQGAVVLPGWDDVQPARIWSKMTTEDILQDHPQSMLQATCGHLRINPAHLPVWTPEDTSLNPRKKLISLALRPAPFTDDWLAESQGIKADLDIALSGVALMIASNPKTEADGIALRLRAAVEDSRSAVLISPDRSLTRRVSAALRRWGIEPDDSAGCPLQQTPPAVFCRLIASCIGQPLRPDVLTAILKHPMAGSSDRKSNRKLFSRLFEIQHLRGGPPEIPLSDLKAWAERSDEEGKKSERMDWADWVITGLSGLGDLKSGTLGDFVLAHIHAAEMLASPEEAAGSCTLWAGSDGEGLRVVFSDLMEEDAAAGLLTAQDYRNLVQTVLSERQSRTARVRHPSIAIWGTREARVEQRDLVILGGLNDTVWPGSEEPDPWLNRDMRKQLGLPTADRQTGLSAHDFQQAFCAPYIMMTRSVRDGEAPTVPSRWIIRLLNLLIGLGEVGQAAIDTMKRRGQPWLLRSARLDKLSLPVPLSPRPAPCPPVDARFKKLSVTSVEKLIRDPYAIYAEHSLRLRKLQPLQTDPDARTRGIALHNIIEAFNTIYQETLPAEPEKRFMEVAEDVLSRSVPRAGLRRIWLMRLDRVVHHLMAQEADRRAAGDIEGQEVWGERLTTDPIIRLYGKADRIDRLTDGRVAIFDYKAGVPPSRKETEYFKKQLDLEAAIAASGGFSRKGPDGDMQAIAAADVAFVEYIGLSGQGLTDATKSERRVMTCEDTARIWAGFEALVRSYADAGQTFPSRPRMQGLDYACDYDHLARKGEWWESDEPTKINLE
ncbi:MAG: double-strand break repair protein AddB [Rhodobacteraceae bacterium]|nr:double-strand break repair protein AddB [Paracoccaceae bacterium]